MRIIGLVVVAAMTISLGSCAALQKLSSTEVPMKAIIVAGNGVDAAETAATAYVRFCTPNPKPAGCNDSVIRNKIIPAVHDVRVARDAAEQFALDNPNATFGPSTLVDAVTKSVGALQAILSANSIKS
ncbi:hypothetical protein [Rhizobium sp. 11515TR]|uniref:hypothetical protein n=1 Tax=Rhizobium sp. 11515TR TaxID=2028343 RepID=UPI000BA8AB5B|nr:hypothetical protein [Rhizobium sp. 11515TR]ASW06321.1 hypothetical protein CKA34_10785 [Rhizobium sp. 11515TR]